MCQHLHMSLWSWWMLVWPSLLSNPADDDLSALQFVSAPCSRTLTRPSSQLRQRTIAGLLFLLIQQKHYQHVFLKNKRRPYFVQQRGIIKTDHN